MGGQDGGQVGSAGFGADRHVGGNGGRVLTAYESKNLILKLGVRRQAGFWGQAASCCNQTTA
ncbi:hypothetical protein Ato02nite_078270 [Paractinoplanes toevensis]|uniref:Uncharacterized protein n=1 Tax=Paractinoplanes toevensis TaxID=571911 RepID=A0A919W9D6_9ACTN|nr:hypothetical protein Ato02nite_078270 [Actinoplanes toevensis]